MSQKELIADFTEYCLNHPKERFWQALRNWSGHNFILAGKAMTCLDDLEDTFYWDHK